MKKCEKCNQQRRIAGERFCKECRKEVMYEMDREYLQFVPRQRRPRTRDEKEETYETKFGVWCG